MSALSFLLGFISAFVIMGAIIIVGAVVFLLTYSRHLKDKEDLKKSPLARKLPKYHSTTERM